MTEGDRAPRVCLLICTYNNARTIDRVLASAAGMIADIIVVDDGSDDGTTEKLAIAGEVDRVRHARNRGKGAAIQTGLDRARDRGFTHVITMDADGQHAACDIPLFVDAIRQDPSALVLGFRRLRGSGRSRKSRVLRVNSNFWIWVATGRRVGDSQTGFRAYPLAPLRAIHFRTTRYDFEIESLALAIWNDVPIREVEISAEYGAGSESHFRPIVDFLRVARLNVHLIAQRIFLSTAIRQRVNTREFRDGPWPGRVGRNLRAYLLQESTSPFRFAACIAVGVCCGIMPIWGFQAALALVLAHRFGLSRALAVIASNVSIPVFMPFILYFSLLTGHALLAGEFDLTLAIGEFDSANAGFYAAEYLVGSMVFSLVAGLVAGLAALVIWMIAIALNWKL